MRSPRARLGAAALAAALLLVAGCGDDSSSGEQVAAEVEPIDDGTAEPAAAGCPPAGGTAEPVRQFDSPPPDCLEPGATYDAVITTNKGEFTIELDAEQSPIATNNFVVLARSQYFDGTECHRIIPDFVIQCGDPTATGTGGPGYTIADDPPPTEAYRLGSVAMARTPAPNSAGSQFFIVTGASGAALPPEYALFGQVSSGFDGAVADMAAAGTPGEGIPSETILIESVTIVQS